jgi:hypothetical protein
VSDFKLTANVFAVPKAGNRPDEYEDATASDLLSGRFAIADGATESSFAAEWARLLSGAFVERPVERGGWSDWLTGPRSCWEGRVGGLELPWYAEEKREAGAFATLLGLEFQGRGWWRAVAIGDSCLFQLRGSELIVAFPLEEADSFDNRPDLIQSHPEGGPPCELWAEGGCEPGDRFLLATDALASWLLAQAEAGRPAWAELEAVADADEFARRVEAWRAGHRLHNDDVTLLVIDYDMRD